MGIDPSDEDSPDEYMSASSGGGDRQGDSGREASSGSRSENKQPALLLSRDCNFRSISSIWDSTKYLSEARSEGERAEMVPGRRGAGLNEREGEEERRRRWDWWGRRGRRDC